ncbi:MAG: helix-turn-helix domain-containing protein [Treponema sp.]|nr:helix-turn-helix domain-containing protein [Treponema sp.]
MIPIFVHNGVLPVQTDEGNIIYRREIMPLLAKARQMTRHYEKAMNCSAIVLDSSGKVPKAPGIPRACQGRISPPDTSAGRHTQLCDICTKHSRGSSQVLKEDEYPCRETHYAALAESQRIERGYVYGCAAGFVFWTSPLFQNGRYAGALVAGQLVASGPGRGAVLEKFHELCKDNSKDNITAHKFSSLLEDVPEKNYEEIKAMAEMLSLCAEEISERKENPGEMIRRKTWQSINHRNFIEPFKSAKKDRASREDAEFDSSEGVSAPAVPRRGFLEKERMLLAAFRRGDNETGSRILKELMNGIQAAMPGNLEIIRFRAIELMVLLSRAALSEPVSKGEQGTAARTAAGNDAMLEINNRYLGRMLESKTAEDLIENLHLGAERMASKIFSFQGMRHASALRRAERYIWENYTRKLSLDEIAKASGLSAPYFSTIFKEEMGENLSSYLNRLRIERTVTLLTETGKSLSEIARLCGFEDQSWFSKIFKSFTGISPGKFRENGGGAAEAKAEKDQRKSDIMFHPLSGDQSRWLVCDWDEQEMMSS